MEHVSLLFTGCDLELEAQYVYVFISLFEK